MTVTVEWDDPQHTTLRTDSHGHWTWEEYHAAVDQAVAMMRGEGHEVHLVNVRHADSVTPLGNNLPHLRRLMKNLPPNHKLTINVNPDARGKMMARLMKGLVPLFTRTFMMASSMDEARAMIAQYERESTR